MVMSNEWRVWVRVGGGRHDSMAGRWVMEVLLIVALGHDIYRENTRSYGFATHIWETGGRDFDRVEMVRMRRAGVCGRGGSGDGGRRLGEEAGCGMHV